MDFTFIKVSAHDIEKKTVSLFPENVDKDKNIKESVDEIEKNVYLNLFKIYRKKQVKDLIEKPKTTIYGF